MIIKTHEEDNKMALELTDSHLKAFREIMERWNAKDEACLLNFMMSVMVLTKTNKLGIDSDELSTHWVTIPDHYKLQTI